MKRIIRWESQQKLFISFLCHSLCFSSLESTEVLTDVRDRFTDKLNSLWYEISSGIGICQNQYTRQLHLDEQWKQLARERKRGGKPTAPQGVSQRNHYEEEKSSRKSSELYYGWNLNVLQTHTCLLPHQCKLLTETKLKLLFGGNQTVFPLNRARKIL